MECWFFRACPSYSSCVRFPPSSFPCGPFPLDRPLLPPLFLSVRPSSCLRFHSFPYVTFFPLAFIGVICWAFSFVFSSSSHSYIVFSFTSLSIGCAITTILVPASRFPSFVHRCYLFCVFPRFSFFPISVSLYYIDPQSYLHHSRSCVTISLLRSSLSLVGRFPSFFFFVS